MARRRDVWFMGIVLVQLVLLVATFPMDRLGTEAWHHIASLGGVLALAGILWRLLARSRRFLAMGVLATTVLATLSGFYLLYFKEGIRIDGYQDWGVFWHIVWSWMFMVFFVMHTWVNRTAYVHFFRRTLRAVRPATIHLGGYVVVVAAFFVTWSTTGRTWFTNSNYIALSLYAWLLATIPAYGAWALARVRSLRASGAVMRADHWRTRRAVDLGLVPVSVLVVVSGIPLAFLDDIIDPLGFKYVSKYWHVWPSVVLAVIVFVHIIQAWPTVRVHWRRLGR